MTELPKAYTPTRRRRRDLRALAGGRRLRARRRGLDGRSGPAHVHDHPAAAERHRLAAPGARPADRGRGPDDPARPDARARDPLPARPRPRQHRRPVRPRRDPRGRRGEPPEPGPRALPRADAGVRRRRPARSCSASSAASAPRPTGVACATPWTTARPRPCGWPSSGSIATASRTGPRRSSTGAPAAGRASATSRSSPRPRPGPCGRSATTSSTRRPASRRSGPDHHRRHDPARDDPRRHGGRRPSRRRALPRRSSDAGCASRSSSGTCRSSPMTVVDPAFGTGAVKITPGPRPRRPRDRPAPRPRRADRPGRRRDHRRDRHGLRRPGPLRGAAAGSSRTWTPAGDLVGERPHEMVIGRCQRSDDVVEPRLKTQWFIRTAPLAARALDATRSGRTRILPPRFEKTWEHWLTDIRDWNVSRQLWWGHRIPAWYCPDGHVTCRAEVDGPTACDGVRPAGRRAASRTRTSSTPGSARACGRSRPWAGPTTTPDLAALLPDVGHGDRLRHHLLLGRPDDDARPAPDRPGAVPHGLPVGPHPRSRGAEDVARRGAMSSIRWGSSTTPGPTPCASPSSTARRPARTSASGRSSWRRAATSPTSSGMRPASWSAPGRRAWPADAERRLPDARHLGPAERWLLSRAAAAIAAVDAAMADYAFGEVTRVAVRRDLERVLRLGCSSWPRSAWPTSP